MTFKVVKNFVIHNTAVTNVSCQCGCGMLSSLLACLSIVTSVAVRHPEPFLLITVHLLLFPSTSGWSYTYVLHSPLSKYYYIQAMLCCLCGLGSSVVIVNGYGLDGLGIESQWGEIFCTFSDWPWGPPSLLYNGYRVFPGRKNWSGHDTDPFHPSSAMVKKEQSYPLWAVQWCTLPYLYLLSAIN